MKVAAQGLKISAIIPAYNGEKWLPYCLRSLLEQSRPLDRIIVVDNASTDSTREVVLAQCSPKIQYLRARRNYGAAIGFSLGLRLANEAGSDWVWLMDQDCIPELDALENLLRANPFVDAEVGALASARHLPDGRSVYGPTLILTHPPRVIDFQALIPDIHIAGMSLLQSLLCQPTKRIRVEHVRDNGQTVICLPGRKDLTVNASFAGLLVSRSALTEAGYPDWRYVHHASDLEWTARLCRTAGLAFVRASRIVDFGPQYAGWSFDHPLHTDLVRNYIWYVTTTSQEGPLALFLGFLRIVGLLTRVWVQAFRRGGVSSSAIWGWVRAIHDGLAGPPRIGSGGSLKNGNAHQKFAE